MSESAFNEEQRFSKNFVFPLVILISAFTIGILGWGIIQQLILHKPYGNHPVSDANLLLSCIFPVIIVLVVDWLLIKSKLVTEIDKEAIRYKFYPFILKERKIYWEEIEKAYVRKYKPLLEYGGWGIRLGIGGKGRALNIRGNYGLQLELTSGKSLLIGTQKPEELEVFLGAIGKSEL